jgi:hypothetical protein
MDESLREEMGKIIYFLNEKVEELPSNIYFVSKALVLIFLSEHKRPKNHSCNYRYFTSEEEERKYVAQLSQFDSQDEVDK